MSQVVVSGLGIVSAAGIGVEAARRALIEGRSGLSRLTRFASPRCGETPVAEVRDIADDPAVSRTVAMGRVALAEALASAGLPPALRDLKGTAGLVVGTSVGGMLETEAAIAEIASGAAPDASVWARHETGATTGALAGEFGFDGPVTTVSNACTSSARAISIGAELLECGMADIVVAGGTDAICRLTLNGFTSLLAMSPNGCRPFDRARSGMSLGEGSAFLVLERAADAARRGARALAVLAGWADTCDAYHLTGPDPEGKGAAAAMEGALARARRVPRDVDYINAHGTGTIDNDRAESVAMRRVFATDLPPFSSTKRVFGHALAASGAMEAIASLLAIRDCFVPGTPGFERLDEVCGVAPERTSRPAKVSCVMSNSFGFGGSNSVLLFAKPDAR